MDLPTFLSLTAADRQVLLSELNILIERHNRLFDD